MEIVEREEKMTYAFGEGYGLFDVNNLGKWILPVRAHYRKVKVDMTRRMKSFRLPN